MCCLIPTVQVDIVCHTSKTPLLIAVVGGIVNEGGDYGDILCVCIVSFVFLYYAEAVSNGHASCDVV